MGPMLIRGFALDKATLEAGRVGLVPELCATNGAFRPYLEGCISCIQENSLDVETALAAVLGPATEYCATVPNQSLISTTMVVTTITALGLNNIMTVATMTVVVDLLATPTSSFISQTTSTASPPTDPAAGENTSESSGGSQAWIAGPVIGGVVALVALVWAYIFFTRRRKRSQSEGPEETWVGKPELHAEGLPGLAKSPVEADAHPRPPQELEGEPFEPYRYEIGDQNYGSENQHGNTQRAGMAANELAAGEMR